MATRGRPERPRSSPPESGPTYGQGTKRQRDFALRVGVSGTKVTGISLRVGVADKQEAEINLRVGVADQKRTQIGLGVGVMDWDGDTKTHDMFGLRVGVGESAGYAAPPRLAIPNALSLGQEVRRRGEPIPVNE